MPVLDLNPGVISSQKRYVNLCLIPSSYICNVTNFLNCDFMCYVFLAACKYEHFVACAHHHVGTVKQGGSKYMLALYTHLWEVIRSISCLHSTLSSKAVRREDMVLV
jgi:hypothetical protein